MNALDSTMLEQAVELLQRIHIAQLFTIGVASAVGVCWLLYRFIRAFY